MVTLPDGMRSGVIKVRLPGCIAGADVEELRFAFELIAEAEPAQAVRKNSSNPEPEPEPEPKPIPEPNPEPNPEP